MEMKTKCPCLLDSIAPSTQFNLIKVGQVEYVRQAYLIALAQMYSAALADGRWSLLAMSESEIREYDTEIFLRPVGWNEVMWGEAR